MTDLLREAENELRRETVEKTTKKAIPFLIGAIVLVVAAGAGLQYWRTHNVNQSAKSSDQYYAAMQQLQSGDLDGGIKSLTEIAKQNNGFGELAAIQKGDVQQEKGDFKGALLSYDEAAKSISNADLKVLAKLRAAYVATYVEDPAKVITRADDIIKGDSAYVLLARELKASALWASGKTKEAYQEYQLLQQAPDSPEGLRIRASQAIAVIDSGADIAPDLLKLPSQAEVAAAQAQAQNQAQAQAQAQADSQQGVERDKDGKRIVRLPPGVKLPPGTKIPDDVRVIETPLPNGATAATQQPPALTPAQIEQFKKQQAQAQAKAKADLQKEIEAERKKAMQQQETTTKAQQQKIEEINKNLGNNSAPSGETNKE